MKINLKNTVFVFYLDDTLYKEAEYHASGIRAVLRTIRKIYGFDAQSYLPLYIP
ncbi:hypothetical protein GCM10007082_30070 [Oceanisphaera arctica]|nr:hypothetical protein GCM10007082_30070 [Oceanisphaera arctica]